MATKRIIGRNMFWNAAGIAVDTGVGVLVLPFLIARLGEATYGVWIVLGALTSYFGLLDLGFRGAIGRHVALYHASGDRAAVNQTVTCGFVVMLVVGAATIVAGFLCEPLFFRLFEVPPERHADTGLALRIVAAQFALVMVFTTFDSTLWGLQRFDWLNFVDIPAAVVRAVLTFALIGSADDLVILACITLGVTAATGLAKAALSFRADPQLRIGLRYLSRRSLAEQFEYGSWNTVGTLARLTRRQLSPLLIGSLLGLTLVVPFSVADRLLVYIGSGLQAVAGVLTPFVTALHATDQVERKRQLFLVGGRYACAVAAFMLAFLIILGGPLLTLWIGPELGAAVLLLTILALGELLPLSQYVTSGVLLAVGRHRALAIYGLVETVILCAASALLIPPLGLIGAALAVAVPGALLRGVAQIVTGCRAVGVPVRTYVTQAILVPIAYALPPSLIVGLTVQIYPPTTWPHFLGYSLAYSVLFAGAFAGLIGRAQLARFWAAVKARRPAAGPAPAEPVSPTPTANNGGGALTPPAPDQPRAVVD